jgi:hypothetical protein
LDLIDIGPKWHIASFFFSFSHLGIVNIVRLGFVEGLLWTGHSRNVNSQFVNLSSFPSSPSTFTQIKFQHENWILVIQIDIFSFSRLFFNIIFNYFHFHNPSKDQKNYNLYLNNFPHWKNAFYIQNKKKSNKIKIEIISNLFIFNLIWISNSLLVSFLLCCRCNWIPSIAQVVIDVNRDY